MRPTGPCPMTTAWKRSFGYGLGFDDAGCPGPVRRHRPLHDPPQHGVQRSVSLHRIGLTVIAMIATAIRV